MLVLTSVGFDQALCVVTNAVSLCVCAGARGREREYYPGEVELGLHAYVVAFAFVLGAEDLEFGRFERTEADGQYTCGIFLRGQSAVCRKILGIGTDLSASAASVVKYLLAKLAQLVEVREDGNRVCGSCGVCSVQKGDLHGS